MKGELTRERRRLQMLRDLTVGDSYASLKRAPE